MIEVRSTAKFGWIHADSIHFGDMMLLKKDKYNRYILTRIKSGLGKRMMM